MNEAPHLLATRTAYDTVAATYGANAVADLPTQPLVRALLAGFAELVRDAGSLPVVDVGCGPGHVTAHLSGLGLDTHGIDLSPAMVTLARESNPDLDFRLGTMAALDLPAASRGGVVALFSIIHTPPEELPAVLAEFHRVLAPGGQLLLGFQVGDKWRSLTEAMGHAVSIDLYLRSPDLVAELLADAGLPVHTRFLHEPPDGPPGRAPRAYLLARRPPEPAAPTGGC